MRFFGTAVTFLAIFASIGNTNEVHTTSGNEAKINSKDNFQLQLLQLEVKVARCQQKNSQDDLDSRNDACADADNILKLQQNIRNYYYSPDEESTTDVKGIVTIVLVTFSIFAVLCTTWLCFLYGGEYRKKIAARLGRQPEQIWIINAQEETSQA